jgi:hypothetical protein
MDTRKRNRILKKMDKKEKKLMEESIPKIMKSWLNSNIRNEKTIWQKKCCKGMVRSKSSICKASYAIMKSNKY